MDVAETMTTCSAPKYAFRISVSNDCILALTFSVNVSYNLFPSLPLETGLYFAIY